MPIRDEIFFLHLSTIVEFRLVTDSSVKRKPWLIQSHQNGFVVLDLELSLAFIFKFRFAVAKSRLIRKARTYRELLRISKRILRDLRISREVPSTWEKIANYTPYLLNTLSHLPRVLPECVTVISRDSKHSCFKLD